jgi:hypothetical protein
MTKKFDKKIEELKKACTTETLSWDEARGNYWTRFFDADKFAESIVRECGGLAVMGQEGILENFGLKK